MQAQSSNSLLALLHTKGNYSSPSSFIRPSMTRNMAPFHPRHILRPLHIVRSADRISYIVAVFQDNAEHSMIHGHSDSLRENVL